MQVSLSELLRFEIADTRGQKATLRDFVSVISDDYPTITGMLWRQKKQSVFLAWDAVSAVDMAVRQITVRDLNESSSFSKCAQPDERIEEHTVL